MENPSLNRKFLETFLSAVLSLVLMAGLLALLIITGFLFATESDDTHRVGRSAIGSIQHLSEGR